MKRLRLIAGIIFLMMACRGIPMGGEPFNALTTPLNQEQVEAFIGAPFPQNATNIYTAGQSALDTMVIIRFDLPTEEVMGYLQSLGITNRLEDGYSPFLSSVSPYQEAAEWWQIVAWNEQSEIVHQGLDERVGAKYYQILVLNPHEDVVTLYLQVYTT
jgi:hypothetical protein